MSPRQKVTADTPRPCGHPRELGRDCRECARIRDARRGPRVRTVDGRVPCPVSATGVPLRHGRPAISAKVVALIEACRPAYLQAIAPRRGRRTS